MPGLRVAGVEDWVDTEEPAERGIVLAGAQVGVAGGVLRPRPLAFTSYQVDGTRMLSLQVGALSTRSCD